MAILTSLSKTLQNMISMKWDSEQVGFVLEDSNNDGISDKEFYFALENDPINLATNDNPYLDGSQTEYYDEHKVQFSTAVPTKDWLQTLESPTINIYLYKVTENTALRNNEWVKEVDPETGKITRKKPNTRINCSYIITAWARDNTHTSASNFVSDVDVQHKILSEAMSILTSYDSIPEECWSDEMKEECKHRSLPPTAALLSDDVKSPGEFWSALDNKLAPFLHYVVTVAVPPKENKAQKVATPVSSIDLRTNRIGCSIEPQLPGYYAIGGQVTGIPIGTIGNIQYYDHTNKTDVSLAGSASSATSNSSGLDELLDALYLMEYANVRNRTGQYGSIVSAEAAQQDKDLIESEIISQLKLEKQTKQSLGANYVVDIAGANKKPAVCTDEGKFTVNRVRAGTYSFRVFDKTSSTLLKEHSFTVPPVDGSSENFIIQL